MKTIAAYNLKGGVGKTATAVNLACLYAQADVKTCLWDLDPQAAASWYLNCKPKKGFKFSKLARQKMALGNQIQATEFNHLDIIPANLTYRNVDTQLARADSHRLKDWLESLSEIYQMVILDCPPSLSSLAEQVLRQADLVLVPALPTYLSFQTYHQLVSLMKDKKISVRKLHPVITMIDRRKKIHCEFLASSRQQFGKEPLGFIPYSSDVEKMGEFRRPIASFAPKSVAALAYQSLWEQIETSMH